MVFSGWLALSFIPGALPAAVYAANTWKNDEQYPQLYPLFAVLAVSFRLTLLYVEENVKLVSTTSQSCMTIDLPAGYYTVG